MADVEFGYLGDGGERADVSVCEAVAGGYDEAEAGGGFGGSFYAFDFAFSSASAFAVGGT